MKHLEPPDITREPNRANIEPILAYLSQLEEVPYDALDARYGLLIRAEVAEQRTAGPATAPAPPGTTVIVQISPSRRAAFCRQVALVDLAITCRNCGRTVIIKHYPGAFPPSTCSSLCKDEVRRQDNAARQRRFRERAHLGQVS
jgi:hypothetical protein